MRYAILGSGISYGRNLPTLRTVPSFRKATANMMIAYEAIEEARAGLSLPEDTAFIMGSSYGELENTKEFLKTFTNSKLARPLLFQSSLHNGTLGFLALELGMKGPSFTVSQYHFTGEKALDLAITLLSGNVVPACLVATVDFMSPELMPAFEILHQEDEQWKDSSSAIILTTEQYAREKGLTPIGFLERVDCFSKGNQKTVGSFNDSDAILHLIRAMKTESGQETVRSNKPDQSYSLIQWSR